MTPLDTTGTRLGRTHAATGTRTRASTVTRVEHTEPGVVREGVFRGRRLFSAAGRTLRAASTWLGATMSPAGWLTAALVAAGLAAGVGAGWSVGWMLAAGSAALLAASIPFLLGAHDYRTELVLDRDRVVAGSEVEGRLVIRNAARHAALPGTVDVPVGDGLVEVPIPFLRSGHAHGEPLTIAARRRGVIDVGPLSISRGDPLGLLRREIVWPEVRTIHVHPRTTPLPPTSAGLLRDLEGLPSRDIVPADLAFHAIREYLPGDGRRHVHWKSTAKTGRLMVRQYEETRQSRIAVVLGTDIGEYAADDEFELAVGVAASLALQGTRDGRDLVVTTAAERPEVVRGAVVAVRSVPTHDARAMLDGFAEIESGERMSALDDVARLTARSASGLSLAVLVTGARTPLDRLRAAFAAFGPDTAGVIVQCDLDADPGLRRAGALRILTVGALGDLGQLLARGALA